MTLSPGTRFGPYEILTAIGAGGMGEVYRATDTKLGREVAIKTLPSALAADTDRLARFEREAKLLATLNHPNIAVIYGLEESDGTQCIAMELIDGATLEEKLKNGPLPVEDALRLALQIAQALEAAHEKGVVHRDLKPANIMVTRDGLVKVLDFGLAKAFSDDPEQASAGHSPALSLAMTQAGLVLGTASYMSPEQASGQATDQRADVWAFGVVLFEMLSGLPLFTGESVPHILASVLQTDPDWNRLPKNLHPRLEFSLQRCLKKKPRERYHSIADARIDIEDVLNDPDGVHAHSDASEVASKRPALPWIAATAVVTAAIAGLVGWSLQPAPEPQAVNRFDYSLPDGRSFRSTGRPVIALSPDGRHFAYNTNQGLFLRSMSDLEAQLIPGTELDGRSPEFSPDSRSVAYYDVALTQIRRSAISGGAPVVIASVPTNLYGLSWEEDGTILYGQPDGVYRVPATGGTPELIIPAEEDTIIYGARLLPDGDSVIFSVGPVDDWDLAQVVAQSLSTGERRVLVQGGYDARYVPTGHLIYTLDDGLFAVVFDADTLTVSGGAVPLVDDVMRGGIFTGAAHFGVSADGTLVYVRGTSTTAFRALIWVDREGRRELINAPPRNYISAQISPDGGRIALMAFDEEFDTWIWDVERETLQRLTFGPDINFSPIWSPDGQQIAFSSGPDNAREVSWQAADGSAGLEPLTSDTSGSTMPFDFSPDGTTLIHGFTTDPSDIWTIAIDGSSTSSTPLIATPADERSATVSPDGRWLAYQSDESGQYEIYVRSFPDVDAGGLWQISNAGGTSPLWSRDGRELFYFDEGPAGGEASAVMAVTVETDETFRPGSPEMLFQGAYLSPGIDGTFYDVSADSQRFLLISNIAVADDEFDEPQIIIVENWFEELERRVPTE